MKIHDNDVLRAIQQLRQHGPHFQTRQLREKLGVASSDGNGLSRIHYLVNKLVQEGVLEEVRGHRKRNKLYRVAHEERFAGLVGVTRTSDNSTGFRVTAPDRLTRIEQSLRILEGQIENIDEKLERLLSIWS